MWDSTPWFVGGGAEHSPEVARVMAFAASGGAEGIVTPEALRVRPLAVPGTSVRVAPGACLMVNRYAGGAYQTYVGRNPVQHEVPIDPTGSGGGRTDLIVARVVDPQYQGQPPANPLTFDYMRTAVVKGVSSNVTSARDLNLSYPAIALAKVTLPANTGTVQASHITDLREVAMPRSYRRLFTHNLVGSTVHALTTSSPSSQYWPDFPEAIWEVEVPEWATHANIVATWGGVRVSRSAAQGVIWARIGRPGDWGEGNVRTQDQKFALDFSALPNEEMRETWSVADDVVVPSAMRGTRQPLRLLGARLASGGPPRMDNASSVMMDVQFTEGPA